MRKSNVCEEKKARGVAKVYVMKDHTWIQRKTFYLTDTQWELLLTTLDVQQIDFEKVTDDAIIIVTDKREKEKKGS